MSDISSRCPRCGNEHGSMGCAMDYLYQPTETETLRASLAAAVERAERAERERDELLDTKPRRDRMFDAAAWDAAMGALGMTRERAERAESALSSALSRAEAAEKERDEARVMWAAEQEASATHRCKVCGAKWRANEPMPGMSDGSWSLVSARCGPCCDNVPMGRQIEPIGHTARLLSYVDQACQDRDASDADLTAAEARARALEVQLAAWLQWFDGPSAPGLGKILWDETHSLLSSPPPTKDEPTKKEDAK